MISSVVLMIVLFDSKDNLSSLYKLIETNSSLERFDKLYESIDKPSMRCRCLIGKVRPTGKPYKNITRDVAEPILK